MFRWIAGRMMKLPPRETGRLKVEKNLPVMMRDGVALLADYIHPCGAGPGAVVLIRSCYGRGAVFGMMAQLLAERGFHTVIQSVRGTGGSGGDFNPMRQEQADGADTLDWVRAQPWFAGRLFTFGFSYLGNAQWAMANGSGDKIDGFALAMTLSNFRDELLSFGGYTQGGTLGWSQTVQMLFGAKSGAERRKRPKLDIVHNHLPIGALDQLAFGKTLAWWQDWINHPDPDDVWWRAIDHSAAVASVQAPTAMVAGWRDIFLPFQLKDFQARQRAGREASIIIGPWDHAAPGGMIEALRQAIVFFSAVRAGQAPFAGQDRVRLFVQGAGVWRGYPSWPPPGGKPLQFYLGSGGRLDVSAPRAEEGSSCYVYDPADPTPAVHGPKATGGAKKPDMSALQRRSDAVHFTSAPLKGDLDIIGPVSVSLSTRSDRAHTDFYACLCDVDKSGTPLHVSDGYVRLRPGQPASDAAGVRDITIECWPTAYRFKRGHRMRLIIASGAHPRYARNLGMGEPLATATNMAPAQQEILHNAEHRSSINLLAQG